MKGLFGCGRLALGQALAKDAGTGAALNLALAIDVESGTMAIAR
jgi:hypothetical protein